MARAWRPDGPYQGWFYYDNGRRRMQNRVTDEDRVLNDIRDIDHVNCPKQIINIVRVIQKRVEFTCGDCNRRAQEHWKYSSQKLYGYPMPVFSHTRWSEFVNEDEPDPKPTECPRCGKKNEDET